MVVPAYGSARSCVQLFGSAAVCGSAVVCFSAEVCGSVSGSVSGNSPAKKPDVS
jgi:hypothetical protein